MTYTTYCSNILPHGLSEQPGCVFVKSGGRQVGSLKAEQMEALWHAFDELTPGYYRRSKLHLVMLRRLLLLARLDPDNQMVSFLSFLYVAV